MDKKSETTILDWALWYCRLGWCVICIPYGTKKARIKWGKYQKSRPDENQLRKWFANERRNIAVVLGDVSGGLACRDFDTIDEYEVWATKHPRLSKALPTVKTANGYHVYFIGHVEGIRHLAHGELRGRGGYCLLPPSVHPDGPLYEWMNPATNENLWKITPEIAGFIVNVTEQTEKTEQTEQTEQSEQTEAMIKRGKEAEVETKSKTKSKEEIETAIMKTLPREVGTRNRQIFEFARAIKSLPQYADADPRHLRELVERWHKKALGNIRTKEFEETWIDFLKAWPRIKYVKGEEPMAKIFERAISLDPPKIAIEKYPNHSKLKILVSLCRELQRAAGSEPFFLSARTAGKLLKISAMQANRWLFLLQSDGILTLVCKGGTAETVRQASRYRYVAD
jgi:hypothetical protein